MAVIIDTGPLVAFFNAHDPHHAWSRLQMEELDVPLLTCEAVLSESYFLFRGDEAAASGLNRCLHDGIIEVDFSFLSERKAVLQLMERYVDVPISFADACLVRMAELHSRASVFTLDGHFRIYRKNGRQMIPVIMPEV